MPYIEANKIEDVSLLKERGLFGMIYFNRVAKQNSLVVFKLTSNSIHQLVADITVPLKED